MTIWLLKIDHSILHLHSGILMSPYEALLGCKVKVEVRTHNLQKKAIDNLENEALHEIIESEINYDDQDN